MNIKQHIAALHELAADTTRDPQQVKEILLKIDRLAQIEEELPKAEIMKHMELIDEVNQIVGKSYPPTGTTFECEGCGS